MSRDQWYDLVVEASADGSWYWDVEQDVVHYSPRLTDMLDFLSNTGEWTPREFLACVHPEDREPFNRELIRHLKGETDFFELEMRVVSDSGGSHWILNRGIARWNDAGRAYCMLGSVVEISQRKHLEESLRALALSATDETSRDFSQTFTRHFAKALDADLAFVGRLSAVDRNVVETVAVCRDGERASNFQYDLRSSPCHNVVGKKPCVYPDRVAELFAQDSFLRDEEIAAYLGAPLFDSNDEPIGIIAALFRRPVADTSTAEDLLTIFASRASAELERQAKVEALRESEQRFKDFAEASSDWFWEMDADLRFSYMSERIEAVTGAPPSHFIGLSRHELLANATGPDIQQHFEDIEAHLPFRDLVYKTVTPAGRRYFKISGRPVFDSEGRFTGYRGTGTDITEVKQAEAEYRDIFNNASEGIYRTSPEGRILRANPTLVRMHGFETESRLIESLTDIATQWYVNPEDRDEITERLAREGRVENFEVQIYRCATGERIWVNENARLVHDENGNIAYYEGTIHDISERRRLEAQYRDIFDNVGEGIYRSTPGGEFVRVNPALARLQGFETPEELLAAVKDLNTDWYIAPGARREMQELLEAQGYVDDFEAEIRRLNRDERLWTSETIRIARDDKGRARYYEGMIRDITAEHMARKVASHRGTVLEMIARESAIGEILAEIGGIAEMQHKNVAAAVLLLEDGHLRSTAATASPNACWRAVDGLTPNEVGGAIQAVLHGEAGVSASFLDAPDAGNGEFLNRMRQTGYAGILATPLRDQQGEVLGVVAVCVQEYETAGGALDNLLREMAQLASIAIEQHRLSEVLRQQAHYDLLTGLPNRALLTDRLEQAIRDAKRGEHEVGVLLLDLDEFKLINDSLGHSAGDELLNKVAARLRGCLRATDSVARLGGDEFVVVVSLEIGIHYCTDVAERLIRALQPNFRVAGREVQARPSIGISLYPGDGRTPETLLQAADTAMYASKNAGKNQCQFFAETMNRQVSERLRIESELHDALRDETLVLFYQPRIVLATGAMCGVEALLRWRHPERGLLDAGEFIHIAERGPLIGDIDRVVVSQAAYRLALWQRAGHNLVLSVNVSARELHADGFAAQVARVLETAGVDPTGLELEITENVVMRDYERTCRQLIELKERAPGLRIAIDDFGSGYSSLNYLRQLPIDTLKIDRSFVTVLGSAEGATAEAIAKTIVDLGRNLGLTVVGEGVETSIQAACLVSYGCHQAQGFLYDRALPAQQLDQRLAAASGDMKTAPTSQ